MNAGGYVPIETEVRVAAEDTIKKFDIPLEAGVVQPIDVVTSAGAPIANVAVLEGVQPDRVNMRFMSTADASGRFLLRGKPGETRLLYFVPEEGSLAVARIRMPRSSAEAKPLQVVIAASSSLRVRTEDESGKAVPAGVVIRYNGEFIPRAILTAVTRTPRAGGTWPNGETVLSRMPAGAYELWALAETEDEERFIEANGGVRPPARVGLSGGEARVTVLAPRRQER